MGKYNKLSKQCSSVEECEEQEYQDSAEGGRQALHLRVW